MGTALIVVLLLALCGFIAYIGDLLGRRLGKKRLSIFGLRPKHTAILLTIVTGVCIALFTFCAALISMPWFRQVVIQGERLAGQNQQLRAANLRQQHENEAQLQKNAELDQLSQELDTQNKRLAADRRKLTGENRHLQAQNQTLEGEARKLSATNQVLRGRNGALQQYNLDLVARNRTLGERNLAQAKHNRQLASERAQLSRDVETLRTQVTELSRTAKAFRDEQFIFRTGEEITRRVIPTPPPEEELAKTIINAMDDTEREARVRGRDLPSGTYEPEIKAPGYPGRAPARGELQQWARAEAAGMRKRFPRQPLLVRVVASANSVFGQPIPVKLEAYPNEVVYHQGEEIASWRVDGAAEPGYIFQELTFQLQLQVGPRVRRKGMLADPMAMEFQYGPALEALEAIRRIGGTAMVRARAKQDTRRAGPLNLELEVTPVDVSRASGG